MLKRVIVLSAVLVVVFASAAAAQYVPGEPGFILNPDTVVAGGEDVSASGIGCPPSTEVAFTIDGVVVGTTISSADLDGGFDAILHIPPTLPAGEYTVVATCGNVRMTNNLTVTGEESTGAVTASSLPTTGSDSLLYVKVGIGLIAVGGLLALGARKRRASV